MALQKCHECGKDVSSEAKSYPNCGAPVKSLQITPKQDPRRGCLFFIAVIIICSFIIGCGNNDKLKIINEKAYSPNIDGFMGVKWEDSSISAKQKILSREESPIIEIGSTPFYFSVKNIKFLDRTLIYNSDDKIFEDCHFRFCSKGFYSGGCFMDDESEDFPKKLKSLIIEKHGQPWKGNNNKNSFLWRSRDNNIIYLNWLRPQNIIDRKYFIIISYQNSNRENECKALNEEAKYDADMKKMEQREEMEKKEHSKKDF